MASYTIEATQKRSYKITGVVADSDMEALASLDEWMSEDFDEFETGVVWDFDIPEEEN